MAGSNLPPAAEVTAWAKKLYSEGVDRRDAKAFSDGFTDDGWVQFGNNPPVKGREAIKEAIAQFFTLMAGVSHEEVGTFYQDGALTLEARVSYTLHRGGTVTVPAVTIFRMADQAVGAPPKAKACRIYVDLAPLFSALQPI